MFRLDDDRVVDATLSGGLARYINHSCNPNCVAETVEIDRDLKIIIFAKRRIQRGEEVSTEILLVNLTKGAQTKITNYWTILTTYKVINIWSLTKLQLLHLPFEVNYCLTHFFLKITRHIIWLCFFSWRTIINSTLRTTKTKYPACAERRTVGNGWTNRNVYKVLTEWRLVFFSIINGAIPTLYRTLLSFEVYTIWPRYRWKYKMSIHLFIF